MSRKNTHLAYYIFFLISHFVPVNILILYTGAKKTVLFYYIHFQRIVFFPFSLSSFVLKTLTDIYILILSICLSCEPGMSRQDRFPFSGKTGWAVVEKGPLLNTVDPCNLKAVGKTGVAPFLRSQRRVGKRLRSLLLCHRATSFWALYNGTVARFPFFTQE